MMREPERLRELDRIISEVTAAQDNHYQYDDVLKRYVTALEPGITDRDVGTLAETDLDTWEQRHQPEWVRRNERGDLATPDISHCILTLEFGWRVYPMAKAKRDDLQSHQRDEARAHIAYLDECVRTQNRFIEVAEARGDMPDVIAEATQMNADCEAEIARTRAYLLSPRLKATYPYAGDPAREGDDDV